jgi:membrane-bound lytic murein transglycosylase MltF
MSVSTITKAVLLALLCQLFGAFGVLAQQRPALAPLVRAHGDLDEILARRQFRLIVPYSKTQFYIDRGRQMGVAAEFGLELEAWLNARYRKDGLPIVVVFLPTPLDRLLPALLEGRGDAVSANLTVTSERRQIVDFAPPWLSDVDEVLVTGPSAPAIAKIEDLAGKEVHARASSAYYTYLLALNADFAARGLAPVRIVTVSERLQDEDLLQMVSAGLLPWAFADDHLAGIWTKLLPRLKVHPEIALDRNGEIAWALRKDSPLLAAELAAFFAQHRDRTLFGTTIRRRYFSNTAALRNSGGAAEAKRFEKLVESFRRHSDRHGFDHLMLAAQGYQESRLDQSRRSPRGAVGVMQLMPATAAAPPVNIRNVASNADRNIEAGAIYMAHLRGRLLADPNLNEVDRALMTFAAYNAGPGNLRKFRRLAAQMDLDPNVWFDNVELAAARIVGNETVQYVGNIFKYYVAYQLAARRAREADPIRSPVYDHEGLFGRAK